MNDESTAQSSEWGGATSTRLEQVVEALVFAADQPIDARRIGEVYGEVTGTARPSDSDIEHTVLTLNQRYSDEERPLRIEAWSGGFRMATISEVAPFIKELLQSQRHRRLSRSLLETLAILCYRQPVTKPEIEFVRGVDSDYAVRRLLEMGLVDVVGRSEAVGRPLLYGTTARFLDLFGLNALTDLPNLREIESILDDPAFHKERAMLLMKKGLTEALPPAAAAEMDVGEGMDPSAEHTRPEVDEAPPASGSSTE